MPFIEITVTVPKQVINVEKVRDSIVDAQNRTTRNKLNALFSQTVQGWKTPPAFSGRRRDTSTQLGIEVYPTGPYADKYVLVNEGARPHLIRPRKAKMLRFQTGYRAGTKRGILRSHAYQRSGEFVRTGLVHHPGFEAREFTETIAETHEPEFRQDMQDAIARGSR